MTLIQTVQTENINLEKIYELRDRFIISLKKREYFPSQKIISNKILKSIFLNEGQVFAFEFARQTGKTTIVTETIGFLFMFYFKICEKYNITTFPFFNVGFFAPQQQQSQTGFNMLKDFLIDCKKNGFKFEFDEFNGDTINIKSKHSPCQAYCFTASPNSHPESKTLNLIVYDESQDLVDRQVEKAISPMGAATNATQVFIGVGGYRRCKFWNLIEQLPKGNKVIIPYNIALQERDIFYAKTLNSLYLNYKKWIEKELRLSGITEDSDHFKTQYKLQWILERGQFITYESLIKLEFEYVLFQEYTEPVFVGVDWGKMHDSTVVTVVNSNGEVLDWWEFLGDDYASQIEQIVFMLSQKYHNVKIINCDSTGTQDMAVDILRLKLREKRISCILNGINFSTHKDPMYKNLSRLMHDTIMNNQIIQPAFIKFPKNYFELIKKEKFINQFLNLQKEIKNNKWSCNHPEGPQYHDDYCDSLALAVYNFKPLDVPKERRFLIA